MSTATERKRATMKKIIAIALAFVASTASAALSGSAHDLVASTSNLVPGTGSCQFCHMVHNANGSVSDPSGAKAPLWAKSVRTYTMYGTTVSGTSTAASIGAISAACLSCHDGMVNAVTTQHNGTSLVTSGGRSVSAANTLGAGGASGGGTLQDDHPVSIQYKGTDATQAGLVAIGSVNTTFLFFGSGSDQMECATCHDPHNGTAGSAYLLRVDTSTDVCAECHANK
jgi:predicted CXXCH cytochrome family protein